MGDGNALSHDPDVAAWMRERKTNRKLKFGDCAISLGFTTREVIDEVLSRTGSQGQGTGKAERIGRILLKAGVLDSRQVAQIYAMQLDYPYVELDQSSSVLRQVLPEDVARTCKAVCIGRTVGGEPRIVMVDPRDITLRSRITEAVGQGDIKFEVGAEDDIEDILERAYADSEEEIAGLADELVAEISRDVGGEIVDDLAELARKDSPISRFTDSLFETAIAKRASDIHVEPQDGSLMVRFRIDGALRVAMSDVAPSLGAPLVQKLKLISKLNITEKRVPQDGRFKLTINGRPRDARIATSPTIHGEEVVIRLLASQADLKDLGDLGLHPDDMRDLVEALDHPHGLILVTGPTGSGKTTTLYSALRRLNTLDRKIMTAEDPVEISMSRIAQHPVTKYLSFADAIRTFLRHDPDIILVGEMRDTETATTGVTAAQTGHLVLSTIHSNGAVETASRMLDIGVPRPNLANTLRLVVAQRLIRTTCPRCAVPAPPSAADTIWLEEALGTTDLPQGMPMRGTGKTHDGAACEHCDGTGWYGRAPIHECLVLDSHLVKLLAHGSLGGYEDAANVKLKGRTLAARAAALALRGLTDVAEARKVAGEVI